MDIQNTHIRTGMGYSQNWVWVTGVTPEHMEILNAIGYGSEKRYGHGSDGMENYLNEFVAGDNVQYQVTLTKNDNGDFMEEYLVTRVEL